jgi:hypothetical protein
MQIPKLIGGVGDAAGSNVVIRLHLVGALVDPGNEALSETQ